MIAQEHLSVEAGYSLWASCYDEDGNPLIAIEEPAMHALYEAIAGRNVLDLGCGTGRHTAALAGRGASVTACDLTTAMLIRARTKVGRGVTGWLRVALPGPLPFADDSFALAVMGLVIEHIAPLEATLREVRRVLEPGGRCLISALHPDLTRQGQTARFIDPVTGVRQPIITLHREVDDMIAIARSAGLALESEQTLVVPEALADQLPRARPYIGTNLGWVSAFAKR